MSSQEPITLTIGTRRSALALKQVELVSAALKAAHPHITFVVDAMATQGDKDKSTPLPLMGKGLWTNELEAKLEARELDFVIHCLKDMPTTLPEKCVLGCITEREDPRDVVVFPKGNSKEGKYKTISELPEGSVVGTSSVRRAAQLKRRFPHLQFQDIRGNIETRMRKLDAEDAPFDCTILAAAGLHRMNYNDRIAEYLSSENGGIMYAVGQGALGLECRKGDEEVMKVLQAVNHQPTFLAGFAERSIMRTLEGGCSVPIGVETTWVGEPNEHKLRLRACVVSIDGKESVEGERTETVRTPEEAEAFGQKLAHELVEKGAQHILDVVNANREQKGPISDI